MNKQFRRTIARLRALANFDHLYLWGGNAKRITLEPDPDVTIVGNRADLAGGLATWHD